MISEFNWQLNMITEYNWHLKYIIEDIYFLIFQFCS